MTSPAGGPPTFGPGSVARGLALIAGLGFVVVALRAGWESRARMSEVQPLCAAPVAVREAGGERLGCASDAELADCALSTGDLVELPGCRVEPGGMPAAMRLLAGLPIDVNRVSAGELQLLDGIGPSTAAAIIESRERDGAFASVDELGRVRGIGPATLATLRARVFASVPAPPPP